MCIHVNSIFSHARTHAPTLTHTHTHTHTHTQSTTVKLQEPDPSEQSDSYKFGLVLRSEQRLTFRATSQTNGKEWVENIRKVLRTHKVTGYGKPSPPSFRDGRRRGAVVQPKPGERASDSDDNFINSPRSRTMPRIRSLTARPTLPSTKVGCVYVCVGRYTKVYMYCMYVRTSTCQRILLSEMCAC